MPSSVTFLNQTPMFERYMVRYGSKNGHKKGHVFRRDWIVCSIYDTLNSVTSTSLMSFLLLYLETLRNICSQFESHFLLLRFPPIYHGLGH